MDLYNDHINRKEIYRYLGYLKDEPDDRIKLLTEKAVDDVLELSVPRSVYMIHPCAVSDGYIEAEGFSITSVSLSKNLKGCERLIDIAATLGSSLDRAIQKYQYSDTAYAVILHAAGAASIESYLDDVSEEIIEDILAPEYRLRPRFSPGYGDLDISLNDAIIKDLDAVKRLGLYSTDSHLLSPSISVTAFIGICKEDDT